MANGLLAKSAIAGGATGLAAGPFGAAIGAAAGYGAAELGSILGKKKKAAPVIPWYKQPLTYEIGGIVLVAGVLLILIKRR